MKTDRGLLEAALIGYQAEVDRILAAMAEIRQQLGGGGGGDITTPFKAPRKKHNMSAAARKRIAEAQKARWAKYYAEKAG